jgi:hypothetical protein
LRNPSRSHNDGGYGELSFEIRCCHLGPKDAVGFTGMMCEDDHPSKSLEDLSCCHYKFDGQLSRKGAVQTR